MKKVKAFRLHAISLGKDGLGVEGIAEYEEGDERELRTFTGVVFPRNKDGLLDVEPGVEMTQRCAEEAIRSFNLTPVITRGILNRVEDGTLSDVSIGCAEAGDKP